MIRTQEEILKRIEEVEDILNVQRSDLIIHLEFENARAFLLDDYVKEVDEGTSIWTVADNPRKQIIDYLDFAYEKANNKRGISAARSLWHFKTWVWLEDKEFYEEILPAIENFDDYGLSVLNRIATHYTDVVI